jgi:hypothetical protein
MTTPVQLVPVSSRLWPEYLQTTSHDFYYTANYHEFAQQQGEGEAWLAIVGTPEKFIAWPFLLRSMDQGLLDITSVYGYAGPLAFGCAEGERFLLDGWEALVARWREIGVVSAFCRFHPLLQNHYWVIDAPALELMRGGQTVSVDLLSSDEQSWADYRNMHRRHMNRARRAGLVCEIDCGFTNLDDFVRLYHGTMRRNSAAAEYFFSAESFDLLRRKLHPAISLHVARMGTQVAAAALVSEYQGIVQYLFGGVDDQFLEISPLKLLLESVRRWGRSRGNRVLHLGGGRGGREDSLFYFKSGFSHRLHTFYTGRCIINPALYKSLSEEHEKEARKRGTLLDPRFFPAYRAPFAETTAEPPSASLVTA